MGHDHCSRWPDVLLPSPFKEGPLDRPLWRLRWWERGEEEEEAEGVEEEMVEEEKVEAVSAQLLFMMSLYSLLTVVCSPDLCFGGDSRLCVGDCRKLETTTLVVSRPTSTPEEQFLQGLSMPADFVPTTP